MNKIKIVCIIALIVSILVSCNIPIGASSSEDTQGADYQALVDQAVAETMAAETQKAPSQGQENPVPQDQQNPPADVPDTVQSTPTVTLTATSQAPMVSVSMDTNCRYGPGSIYDYMGAFTVGQNAEVIGRSAASDYWVIRLPSTPSITCWIWGQYATVVGNRDGIPIIEPPPTPTPTRTPTRTLPPPAANPVLTIVNNSGTTIFYVYFSLSSSPNWGDDRLGTSTIGSGGFFSWSIAPGTYDIKLEDSSHNILQTWFSQSITSNVTYYYP